MSAKPDFAKLWASCEIDPKRVKDVAVTVARLRKNLPTYERIGHLANCSWWVPALLHYRESSKLTLDVYLHNGQKLGVKTTIKPKGILFRKDQFVEAAVDALKRHGLFFVTSPVVFLPFAEKYNGLGYRKRVGDKGRIELSPYIWAATNHHDETSKYTHDGKYDPRAVEKQLGVAAILRGLVVG
jgi:lysozyme family protein